MNDTPVAIFWDFENCSLALGRTGFTVARSIESIAQKYGSLKLFKAYLDAQKQPLGSDIFRAELQSSGVSVTDCPHIGRKEVADRMLQGDLMAFALDNPAPATVIIISADRDFAYAASVLRQRRYNVVMISHSNPRPNLWLTSQAIDCYDWKKDVLHVEERATTIPTILGKSVPTHAEVLAQCLAPIPSTTGANPSTVTTSRAPVPPVAAPQAVAKTADPPSPTDNSLSHIPPKLRGLVQALHKLAPKFGPVQRTDVYGQIRTIDPSCSRDEFKQLLRAGRAQHLIKTGKKPHKWVSLRPECLTAKTSDGRTSEELVDSGHESSSSDEDDTLCEVPIPLGFDILVRALRDIGPTGDYSMKLGDVAVLIAKHNRRPYLLAGVGKLKAYLEVGERHGVIQRVGPKTTYLMGHVALADKYRRLGRPSPPPFVMTHSRRSSDTTVVSDSVEQASELAEKPHSYVGSDSGFEEESGAEMTAPVSVSVKVEAPACPAQPEPAPVNPPKVDEVVSAPLSEPDSVVADESTETDIASQAPSIPSGFDVLVRVLQEVGPGGEYRMKRLDLAELMSAKHGRMPYVQAGVGKFSRYLELAVSLGIVEVEGKIVGGKRKAKTAVVILREAYRASPIASPSVSPMPSEESDAPAQTSVPVFEQAPSTEEPASLETEALITTSDAAESTAAGEVIAEECTTCESPATVVNEPLAADTQEVPLAVKTTPFSEQSSWAFELISPNPPEIEIDFSCTESLETLVASSNTFMTFDKPSVTDIDEEDTAAAAETHISAPQSFVSDISTVDVDDPTPSPPPSATAGDIDVLIEVLHSHLDKGFTEPLRSIVDFDLRYRLGWEGNLNGLFLQAEAAGLIRTGVHRYSGLEWVALVPAY